MTDKMDYRDHPIPATQTPREILEAESDRIIDNLLVEIPIVQGLLQDEIDRIDRQLKRWRGRLGFWRFLWDDIRGRAK